MGLLQLQWKETPFFYEQQHNGVRTKSSANPGGQMDYVLRRDRQKMRNVRAPGNELENAAGGEGGGKGGEEEGMEA
ncbi:hypothetical protein SK128_022685 [Halocaridina rubra]|uniref:Uncharacterized protein n=1 Tax=Halocaridina rubra TaxID=373956 RepID=A0AAN8ZYW4_HALRR